MSERKGTKALELWCKRLVKHCPEVTIENMTTSWRNGIAFCALVHYFKPNSIPMSTLNPNDIYFNNQLAFSIAEKELGIPALLDPEDMVENEIPDRLSILTYLSQFYQRLGHTVTPKTVENESKDDHVSQINTPISNVSRNFVKVDLDKCTTCGQSVYLAQRLLVSHKMYHRRCFKCYKCSVQLSPGSYSEMNDSLNICCEACKSESNTNYDNKNDALMGMLEFSESLKTSSVSDYKDTTCEETDNSIKILKTKPLSVLEKINIFEKNKNNYNIEEKVNRLSLRENKSGDSLTLTEDSNSKLEDPNWSLEKDLSESQILHQNIIKSDISFVGPDDMKPERVEIPDDLYKSNVNKFMFLQSQLLDSNINNNENQDVSNNSNIVDHTNDPKSDVSIKDTKNDVVTKQKDVIIVKNDVVTTDMINISSDESHLLTQNINDSIDESNSQIQSTNSSSEKSNNQIQDINNSTKESHLQIQNTSNSANEGDLQIPNENNCTNKSNLQNTNISTSESNLQNTNYSTNDGNSQIPNENNCANKSNLQNTNNSTNESNLQIQNTNSDEKKNLQELKNANTTINVPPRLKKSKKKEAKLVEKLKVYPDYLNPFSDDDEEEEKNVVPPLRVSTNPFGSSDDDEEIQKKSSPIKRLITANPFWSDGEEPTSEDESYHSSGMYTKSPITASTPNISTVSRHKKGRAPPPPPPAIAILEAADAILETADASFADDVVSITSGSSFNSTLNSEHKTPSKLTPRSRKKMLAPTPPDSLSMYSSHDANNSLDKSGAVSLNSESGVSRRKGPAPGLPLPARREVRTRLPDEELQAQLELLDTQQLGLERQGVLIEQMIRDKCEGDDSSSVSQDEVEELVIQLCELVNEKNDLFRKHTELMYIRRQQRLEKEQADIEHNIRVIQSKPVVNRTDSDKCLEEQLVSRLVETVRRRDELVQQLEAERCRERLEDRAIACSIASRRAQRNSDSNTSSMKSFEEVPTPKKNKIKDKVKKQLKKAKHTMHIKKKEEKVDNKEKKNEKEHKTKWF